MSCRLCKIHKCLNVSLLFYVKLSDTSIAFSLTTNVLFMNISLTVIKNIKALNNIKVIFLLYSVWYLIDGYSLTCYDILVIVYYCNSGYPIFNIIHTTTLLYFRTFVMVHNLLPQNPSHNLV